MTRSPTASRAVSNMPDAHDDPLDPPEAPLDITALPVKTTTTQVTLATHCDSVVGGASGRMSVRTQAWGSSGRKG
ncbi:hypothetical protein SGFS_051170 [Streptomyces graminofaciens]|uniref:Uncharacterized protein n=1 Tax=Streptomyces graminofaciens TaxID=68212 RepID=A0ABN5VN29_9ACTN|nr:hypothetical protein SGFS_051170 [Streptomyces graminofaciens]